MKKILMVLSSVFLLLGFVQTVLAIPHFTVGENEFYYRNYESVFRYSETTGMYEELDYTNYSIPPNVTKGDIFVGIISIQEITQLGTTIWASSPGVEELTGIFAQEITNISQETSGVTIDLGFATANTFSPLVGEDFSTGLAPNEMFNIYFDDAATQFTVNKTQNEDVAAATDGTKWLTLGKDGGDNEYAWSFVTPFGTELDAFQGESYIGSDVLFYAGGEILGSPLINDPGEARYDTDVMFYANSELEGNDLFLRGDGFGGTVSDWVYASNDPAFINAAIPEPGTIFLLGAGLLGIAGIARRKI